MPRPKGSRNKPKAGAPVVVDEIDEPRPMYHDGGGFKSAAAAIPEQYPEVFRRSELNGTLPRSERNCANCDASRLVGRELRCWVEPPAPQVAGWLPPLDEGGVGRPIVLPLQRPTFPEYVCPRWIVMQADHPDFGAVAEAEASPAPVESRH